ncbi:MAG: pyruvate formate lyase-activating protein, partial [Chloroflexi bacterium]
MRCYHGPTMRILAIDVGTGTQDILLFDSDQPIENALQLIMPSPTQIAAGRIRRATESGHAVFLTGVIAGGGPCHWALEDHLRASGRAFATGEAAATFDDDLENVQRMGVELVSED